MFIYRTSVLITCCGLLIASAFYSVKMGSQTSISPPNQDLAASYKPLELVKAISVKITANNSSGSGVIVQKNGNIYTVVTNRHVVDRGNVYHIYTNDRIIHQGKIIVISEQDDLAILEFTSDRIYPVVTVNPAPLELHKNLIAAGFPYNSDCLEITSGKLILQTQKPLKQGYQLGYSNDIQKGMSGGGIFNSVGEVVGINGRSANPIIADYQYQDLTYPNKQLQEKMTQLSWGIPINKAMELITD